MNEGRQVRGSKRVAYLVLILGLLLVVICASVYLEAPQRVHDLFRNGTDEAKQMSDRADELYELRAKSVAIDYLQEHCATGSSVTISDEGDSRLLIEALARKVREARKDKWSHNSPQYRVQIGDTASGTVVILAATPTVIRPQEYGSEWFVSGTIVAHALCAVCYAYYGIDTLSDRCFLVACHDMSGRLLALGISHEERLESAECEALRRMIPKVENRYRSIEGHRTDLVFEVP